MKERFQWGTWSFYKSHGKRMGHSSSLLPVESSSLLAGFSGLIDRANGAKNQIGRAKLGNINNQKMFASRHVIGPFRSQPKQSRVVSQSDTTDGSSSAIQSPQGSPQSRLKSLTSQFEARHSDDSGILITEFGQDDMLQRLNGQAYSGGKLGLVPFGMGEYIFPNGDVYVGHFENGTFQGEGTIYLRSQLPPSKRVDTTVGGELTKSFPLDKSELQNCSRFVGDWKNGRLIRGKFLFADGLEFHPIPEQWSYCTDGDRRFYSEHIHGISFQWNSQLTDKQHTSHANHEYALNPVPYGYYDLGNCYLNPNDNKLYNLDHTFYRDPTPEEITWAKRKARIGLDPSITASSS